MLWEKGMLVKGKIVSLIQWMEGQNVRLKGGDINQGRLPFNSM